MAANSTTARSSNVSQPAQPAEEGVARSEDMNPVRDMACYLRTYAREQPEMAAIWCFGIGFIVGWRLKPW